MTKAYAFAGNTMTVLVPGEQTGGAFAVLHVIKPSGSSTPPHSHDTETELSYVLSGWLGVETEGRTVAVGAGDFALLPPGRPHRLFNDSGAVEREFLLCAPAKFDRFVAAAGVPVAPFAEPRPMTDEDRKRLVAEAPEFGVRLLRSAAPPDERPAKAPTPPQRLEVLGARIEPLAQLGDADSDMALLRQSLPPGASVPLHSHADAECVFVTDGELELYLDSPSAGWRRLAPDEAIHVGPNIRHAIRNSGTAPANFLLVTSVRLARFFAAVGSPAAGAEPRSPIPEDIAALRTRGAADGYRIAMPDECAAIGLTSAV